MRIFERHLFRQLLTAWSYLSLDVQLLAFFCEKMSKGNRDDADAPRPASPSLRAGFQRHSFAFSVAVVDAIRKRLDHADDLGRPVELHQNSENDFAAHHLLARRRRGTSGWGGLKTRTGSMSQARRENSLRRRIHRRDRGPHPNLRRLQRRYRLRPRYRPRCRQLTVVSRPPRSRESVKR